MSGGLCLQFSNIYTLEVGGFVFCGRKKTLYLIILTALLKFPHRTALSVILAFLKSGAIATLMGSRAECHFVFCIMCLVKQSCFLNAHVLFVSVQACFAILSSATNDSL